MTSKPIFVILCLTLLLSGCVSPISIDNAKKQISTKALTKSIAGLPKMEVKTVENFEQYKTFADHLNALIQIINRERGLQIPEIEKSVESFEKVSNIVEAWTPLIENYNNLIDSARDYDDKKRETVEKFYTTLGIFGLETTIVFTASFYKISFETVGFIFRSSGFNAAAFHCPACVSAILSSMHWLFRNTLVDETSAQLTPLFEGFIK
ncbi:MAG: hypothetical protein IPJ89_02790 [Candidatus Iainarchaeum archaeon]|uniref:Lipoprotein n=1 Tax=Candidatus Iainarchaeum sp. TaxID=3101447 RepID=A0A7T9I272_9ARCH|nr:MAG: hypothetical protein IPJ89_02790 [Candidatus Diapherotrites archaeon]